LEGSFREIDPEVISDNLFKLLGKDFMLIAAGNAPSFNFMTASWGGFGVLWGKKVSFIVVRPKRYTYEFIEKSDTFSLNFFDKKYKEVLMLCGTKSGREIDKMLATGLHAITHDGPVYFEEARLVLQCSKLYHHDLTPTNFVDPTINDFYPEKDYHRLYIGEVTRCLSR
jgi:flavin reductase (DIM6/NTAB) family NADH-FMN oxidoreductase RutF